MNKLLEELRTGHLKFDISEKLYLRRIAKSAFGINGVLVYKDIAFAVTIEDPEKAIEAGEYDCIRTKYIKGKYETFEIIAPPRTRLLFHKGNWASSLKEHIEYFDDVDGCIATAESFAILNGVPGIADSKHGFNELMQIMYGVNKFRLEIQKCYGQESPNIL